MSGCLTVLLMTLACRRGVLAPEAGGVLPAELSEDLFSTEHRRLRSPKLPGPGSDAFECCRTGSAFCFVCVSVSFCVSDVWLLDGDSDSWNKKLR